MSKDQLKTIEYLIPFIDGLCSVKIKQIERQMHVYSNFIDACRRNNYRLLRNACHKLEYDYKSIEVHEYESEIYITFTDAVNLYCSNHNYINITAHIKGYLWGAMVRGTCSYVRKIIRDRERSVKDMVDHRGMREKKEGSRGYTQAEIEEIYKRFQLLFTPKEQEIIRIQLNRENRLSRRQLSAEIGVSESRIRTISGQIRSKLSGGRRGRKRADRA